RCTDYFRWLGRAAHQSRWRSDWRDVCRGQRFWRFKFWRSHSLRPAAPQAMTYRLVIISVTGPEWRLPSRTHGMKRLPNRARLTFVFLIAVLLVVPVPIYAYAVLSHEAIIDAAWEAHIKPLLMKKFPQATD